MEFLLKYWSEVSRHLAYSITCSVADARMLKHKKKSSNCAMNTMMVWPKFIKDKFIKFIYNDINILMDLRRIHHVIRAWGHRKNPLR